MKTIKKRFMEQCKDNRGMGTVEMILIIVVLIGLVLIFKNQIQQLAAVIFDKISVDSAAILS
ncbi:MAG: Flp1 family type IVb pilin [Firmicutes bacterium]|nr:Flp1 family type IVb pilin [Bacillota bacterium]